MSYCVRHTLLRMRLHVCRVLRCVSLMQRNTRHTPVVRHILSSVRPTQYDTLPQHQVNIRKLISECF